MPFPVAAAVAAGAQLIGTGANALATGSMNRKTRAYNREMYELQKSDNIKFWEMQNSYNSPQAQMARFQEAGLNPNLIYGQGNSGNSGAVATPHMEGYSPARPNLDPSPAVEGYFNTQAKKISIDNMKKQGDILEAQKRTLDADVVNKLFRNELNTSTFAEQQGYIVGKNITQAARYNLDTQTYEFNKLFNALRLQLGGATLEAVQKDNIKRDSQTNLLNQSFDINEIRKRFLKDDYDSSLKGMKLQDWLRLLLGATGQVIRR